MERLVRVLPLALALGCGWEPPREYAELPRDGSGTGLDASPRDTAITDYRVGVEAPVSPDASTAAPPDSGSQPPPDVASPGPSDMGPNMTPMSCPGGQHICPVGGIATCVSNSDLNSCGSSCAPCPKPDRSVPVCLVPQGCSFTCERGATECRNTSGVSVACGVSAWDFEEEYLPPWDRRNSPADSAIVAGPLVATSRSASGLKSLRASITVTGQRTRALLGGSSCPIGAAIQTNMGMELSAQVFLTGAPPEFIHQCQVGFLTGHNGDGPFMGYPKQIDPGRWNRVNGSVSTTSEYVGAMVIDCKFGGTGWSGDLFVDDIRYEPYRPMQ
jgi:hypothetical protein